MGKKKGGSEHQPGLFDNEEPSPEALAMLFNPGTTWTLRFGTAASISLVEAFALQERDMKIPCHDVHLAIALPDEVSREEAVKLVNELLPGHDEAAQPLVVWRQDREGSIQRGTGREAGWGEKDTVHIWKYGATIEITSPEQAMQFLSLVKKAPRTFKEITVEYNREWINDNPPALQEHFARLIKQCGVDLAVYNIFSFTNKIGAAHELAFRSACASITTGPNPRTAA